MMSLLVTEEVVSLARGAIRCGNGPESNRQVQALLLESLAGLPLDSQEVTVNQTCSSVTLIGEQGPLVLFVGHSDVVSTGDVSAWKHPPFSGDVEQGQLFGRGSVDMRAANAAFVVALKRVWPEIAGRIRVAIAIAGDEETSAKGSPAILKLLQDQQVAIAACIVGEPSAAEITGDRIRIGRRGSLSGSFRFSGAQTHTAYVGGEENVLHTAVAAARALSEIEWPRDAEPWPKVNFHLTNFQSGTGESNVVPGSAEFRLNVRFGPSLTREQVIERCLAAVNTLPHPYEVDWTQGSAAFYTADPKFPDLVAEAVASVMGSMPARAVDGGTSDGRFFARAGIPTVELGTPARGLHQVNEALQLSDLLRLQTLYESTLRLFAQRAGEFEAVS